MRTINAPGVEVKDEACLDAEFTYARCLRSFVENFHKSSNERSECKSNVPSRSDVIIGIMFLWWLL